MSGNPFADLEESGADETGATPAGRRRTARPAPGRFPLWAAVVVALVGVAAGLFIWDQVKTRYHKNRLQEIKREWFHLDDTIRAREVAIEAANPGIREASILELEFAWQEFESPLFDRGEGVRKPRPDMTLEQAREKRRRLIDNDAELKRLNQQIWEIEQERNRILRDHPEWK
jgi:hypothetical protein